GHGHGAAVAIIGGDVHVVRPASGGVGWERTADDAGGRIEAQARRQAGGGEGELVGRVRVVELAGDVDRDRVGVEVQAIGQRAGGRVVGAGDGDDELRRGGAAVAVGDGVGEAVSDGLTRGERLHQWRS